MSEFKKVLTIGMLCALAFAVMGPQGVLLVGIFLVIGK